MGKKGVKKALLSPPPPLVEENLKRVSFLTTNLCSHGSVNGLLFYKEGKKREKPPCKHSCKSIGG